MTQRVHCYNPRALVDCIFVFFIDMFTIDIVNDVRTCQSINLRRYNLLQTSDLSMLNASWSQSIKRIDKFLISWQSCRIEHEILYLKIFLAGWTKSNRYIHLIRRWLHTHDSSFEFLTVLISFHQLKVSFVSQLKVVQCETIFKDQYNLVAQTHSSLILNVLSIEKIAKLKRSLMFTLDH